jgi:predicted DNA binding protein
VTESVGLTVVEATVETPLLTAAVGVGGEVTARVERDSVVGSETAVWIVCARTDDHGALTAALESDPTVGSAEPVSVTDDDGWRRYWLELSPSGWELSPYPRLGTDTVLRGASRATDEPWQFRLEFRDDGAIRRLFDRWNEVAGVDATPVSINRGVDRPDPPNGLSEPQREALRVALERGYFDVPRETSLARLGAELGVSDTAVSLRLRRGISAALGGLLDDQPALTPPDRDATDDRRRS